MKRTSTINFIELFVMALLYTDFYYKSVSNNTFSRLPYALAAPFIVVLYPL